ncbi:glycerol-3-phosphate dehydrogenase/oxidase [Psychromicrobium xiongbiense]|uniref:glycerol-3-phosphate dehydrogenase/oxidase n=1 Tax=Psychromicrobium xiongbiense TaxID=3051184 RepID=UPI00255448AA|nr:glycerol-3-phosphate dehydrogenase/oxidase [Psychromicrobium sp. YIM S02556]
MSSHSEHTTTSDSAASSAVPVQGEVRTSVEALKDRPRAQVLIIGGGINGVGTFRDLALQGIDVALVERGDYCQGASGASSHMIHGGIRYLENGEFRLVKESVEERNRLLKIAPHYVKPLKTTIPIFSTVSGVLSAPMRFLTHKQGKPQERGALLIKLGLSLYDSFSRDGGTVPRHQFVGHKKALEELPRLRSDVKYAATYFDASVHNPERLTLDVLRDGVAAGTGEGADHTARPANYVAATAFTDHGVELTDQLSGETFTFDAEVVVNTSGAWVDLTNEALGAPTSFMGGTKGSHIVLDSPELLAACAGREIFFEHTDGRIVLIYPLADRVLVGTTDINADPRVSPVCTEEEIEYFFELVNHVFPDVSLDREQIIYTFSGIRPLPKHDDTQPGFVSRDYRIEQAQHRQGERDVPVLSLVGGKWTTFRALSEHLSNEVLALLGASRTISTAELAIGGGVGFPRTDAGVEEWITAHQTSTVDAARAATLLTRYGTRADDVIAFLQTGPDAVLHSTHELSSRELLYLAEQEQIGHLIDVFIRRTSLAFRGLVSRELLAETAEILAEPLGWDAERVRFELEHAQNVLERDHLVQVQNLIA